MKTLKEFSIFPFHIKGNYTCFSKNDNVAPRNTRKNPGEVAQADENTVF